MATGGWHGTKKAAQNHSLWKDASKHRTESVEFDSDLTDPFFFLGLVLSIFFWDPKNPLVKMGPHLIGLLVLWQGSHHGPRHGMHRQLPQAGGQGKGIHLSQRQWSRSSWICLLLDFFFEIFWSLFLFQTFYGLQLFFEECWLLFVCQKIVLHQISERDGFQNWFMNSNFRIISINISYILWKLFHSF